MSKTTKSMVHGELMKLYNRKRLTPTHVVEIAKNPESPLHDEIFDCDDVTAAYKHRLQKARNLITWFEITVMVHKTEFKMNEFVHSPFIPKNQQGYIKSLDIKDDAQAAVEFLRTELLMARAYIQRCIVFAATLGIESEVQKMLNAVNRLITAVSPKDEDSDAA